MSVQGKSRVVTTHVLQTMKDRGERISMLTGYDYSMASLLDQAGVDVILVGDSAANVVAGFQSTLPITLNQMIYHASSVVRAVKRALVVVDMPFGTYQGDSHQALQSAIRGRCYQAGGGEGGGRVCAAYPVGRHTRDGASGAYPAEHQ